jgi:L-alanine-DL-glutamate epimerase-like enolase superfamily enzyme
MDLKLEAITAETYRLPLEESRAISREVSTTADVVVVEAHAGGHVGRGEASPTARYTQTLAGLKVQIDLAAEEVIAGGSRAALQTLMPPGAARNAVDAALWDLEAKLSGRSVEAIAGLGEPRPVITAYTIPIKPPAEAGKVAERERHRPLIKVKLGRFEDDRPRLEAIRRGAPDATLIVDANEGWSLEQLQVMAPIARDLGVALIEQPLHADRDEVLAGMDVGIPLCADESCHTRESLDSVAGRYQFVNIKLDKTGGLTEALALAAAARERGLGLMVGCTHGTTLALAPAYLIARMCAFSDLDAPLFLAQREAHELVYEGSNVSWSGRRSWGLA